MNALLVELFSSKVRAAVLEWMIPRPHLGASLTDLSRLLGLPVSSLQHECYKLERIGILFTRKSGNARLYRPRPDCPILLPLAALVAAAIGPATALRAALEGVGGIDEAFVAGTLPGIAVEDRGMPSPVRTLPATNAGPGRAGSFPSPGTGPLRSGSSTDTPRLVIIGDLPLDELGAVLGRAEAVLGMAGGSLELAYFRLDDWHQRQAEGNPFVRALVRAPRISLVGVVTGH